MKRYKILFAVLAIMLLVISGTEKVQASTPLNDCSNRIQIPVDYASQIKTAIQNFDGTVINSTWKISVAIESQNPNKIFVTATAPAQQQNIKIWNTTTTPSEMKIDFTSVNGNLYRLSYDPHGGLNGVGVWGSVSKFTPADSYTRSYTVYCGFINTRVDVVSPAGLIYMSARPSVKQDINLGFLDPISTTGGGGAVTVPAPIVNVTSTGINKAEMKDLIIKSGAYILAIIVAIKLILMFKYRG